MRRDVYEVRPGEREWTLIAGAMALVIEKGALHIGHADARAEIVDILRVHDVSVGGGHFLALEDPRGRLVAVSFGDAGDADRWRRLAVDAASLHAQALTAFADDVQVKLVGSSVQVLVERAVDHLRVPHGAHGDVCAGPLNVALWPTWLGILASEMSWYATGLWQAANIDRIVVCCDLKFDGAKRQALPHLVNRVLYVDGHCATHDRAYLARIMHHEIYHFLDVYGGAAAAAEAGDPEWAALNPPGFRYGEGGGAAAQTAHHLYQEQVFSADANPAFVSSYAMSAPEEDRAETFAALVVDGAAMASRAAADPLLKSKLDVIIGRVYRLDTSRPSLADWARREFALPLSLAKLPRRLACPGCDFSCEERPDLVAHVRACLGPTAAAMLQSL